MPSRLSAAGSGFRATTPGFLGLLVKSGAAVLNFANVPASAIASLSLDGVVSGAGTTLDISASPLAADGTILAGSLACTFVCTGGGSIRVAGARTQITISGPVRVDATCNGMQASYPPADTFDADAGEADAAAPDDAALDAGEEKG